QVCEQVAVLRKTGRQAKPSLPFEDLSDDPSPGSRLNSILDILDENPVAGRCRPVNLDLKLGLTDEMVVVQVGDPANWAQCGRVLPDLRLQGEQIGTKELDCKLPLDAGQRFVDVVLDGLREVCREPWKGYQRVVHRLDEFVLIFDLPLTAWLETNIELIVVRTVRIGTVIGRARLGDNHSHLRKRQ